MIFLCRLLRMVFSRGRILRTSNVGVICVRSMWPVGHLVEFARFDVFAANQVAEVCTFDKVARISEECNRKSATDDLAAMLFFWSKRPPGVGYMGFSIVAHKECLEVCMSQGMARFLSTAVRMR